jgi:hypothetical protein
MKGPTPAIEIAFLQQTLVRFFIAEQSARDPLIPVILSLVGCEPAVVKACEEQWRENNRSLPFTFL